MVFRNEIQGLRAIAFILVFIFHLNSSFLPGGFLGVDVFFVISGFLVSSIVTSDINNKKFSFLKFYTKRLKRILPAFYISILLIYLVGIYFFSYLDFYSSLNTSFKYAFVFLSNIFFQNGESYFGPSLSENPYLHTWSLSIEMQFYLFLPVLLYFGRKYLRYILPFILVLSVAYSCKLIYFDKAVIPSYFSLLSRISEFIIGIIYAQYLKKGFFKKKTYNDVTAYLSFLVLISCSLFYSENMNFPGFLCLIPCIATGNILVSNNDFLSKILSNKYFVFIGSLSYSLYLWHWPIMAFIRYESGVYEFSFNQVLFIIFLTFILSYLSYRYVEIFFMNLSNKISTLLLVLFVLLTGFIFMNKESLIGHKKIPDVYSCPIFGVKSHFEGIVENFGSLDKKPSFLLTGNSHALMIKPFLNQIAVSNDFSFYSLTCDAYPPISGIESKLNTDVEQFNFANGLVPLTYEYIDKVPLVVIAVSDFRDFKIPIKQLADTLLKQNKKLIIINSFPTLEEVNIIKENKGYINKIGKLKKKESNLEDFLTIKDLTRKYKNVRYYDMSKSLIFENAPFYNDTLIYYNSNHINHYGSIKLANDLGDEFYTFIKEYLK